MGVIQWGAENGHAGIQHYWPSRPRIYSSKAEKDAAIRRDSNGSNVRKLMDRYDLSATTIDLALRGAKKERLE